MAQEINTIRIAGGLTWPLQVSSAECELWSHANHALWETQAQ